MSIVRIESLTYGVADLDASKRFYADWGLALAENGSHGADYRLPSGQLLHVRSCDDPSLPIAVEGGSTIREIVWGVDAPVTLDALAAALAVDRNVTSSGAAIHAVDPWGMGIGFTVAHGNALEVAQRSEREANEPFAMEARVQPSRIGHVVLNVPDDRFAQTQSFYLDRLNFRLTDRVNEFGDFMRCSGSRDHHNQFLLKKPQGGLNHVAFEVPRIDEIIVGGTNMRKRGWEQATSLGRHIMGSNVFWYFQNPSGGLAEYFSDMDVMDDDWEPRVWETNPGFSLWVL